MIRSFVSPPVLTTGVVALGLGLPAWASVENTLAAASYDADNYLAFGVDHSLDLEMSLGAHIPFAPTSGSHFNFGVVEFDVSSLSAAGDKHLHMDLELFRTTEVGDQGPTGNVIDTTTGNATLRLVALGDDYIGGYSAAPDRRGWYDTNLFGQDVIAAVTLTDAGVFSIDVTDTVNAWIADGNSNHGFGLVVESGSPIELGATEGGNGARLSSVAVPEPGTLALLGLGGLLIAHRRRA